MDKKLYARLMLTAIIGLGVAGLSFLGIYYFDQAASEVNLYFALGSFGLAGIFSLIMNLYKS